INTNNKIVVKGDSFVKYESLLSNYDMELENNELKSDITFDFSVIEQLQTPKVEKFKSKFRQSKTNEGNTLKGQSINNTNNEDIIIKDNIINIAPKIKLDEKNKISE